MTLSLSSPRLWLWSLPIFSLLGFADAVYLTAKHYLGGSVSCLLFEGCDLVTTSVYATIGQIPIALLGALFYLSVTVLSLLYLQIGRMEIFRIILALAVSGLLFSFYLLYVQAFVLEAFCSYCLVSAALSVIICLISVLTYVKLR